MNAPEVIKISWEEWKRSRAAKREALRAAGLDAPSRRQNGTPSADRRLRKAFAGARVPTFA